jgi:hypothetical protein
LILIEFPESPFKKMKKMQPHPHPNLPPEGEGGSLSALEEEKYSLPLRGRCAETWSRGPDFGDATVEAHISTRAIAALHPAAGSHPSAKADGTCSALRGRRVGVVLVGRFVIGFK